MQQVCENDSPTLLSGLLPVPMGGAMFVSEIRHTDVFKPASLWNV